MLTKRVNPKTKKKEYCLVSASGRSLRYFGKQRPTSEEIAHEEARIDHFANRGK